MGLVLGGEADGVAAAARRGHPALPRPVAGGDDAAAAHRIRHPLAVHLTEAAAGAVHPVPLAPHHRALDADAVHPAAVRPHGDHGDALGGPGHPEVVVPLRPRPYIKGSRMDHGAGPGAHHLAVHVGHGRLHHGARRLALGRLGHGHLHRGAARGVQRVLALHQLDGAWPAAGGLLPPVEALPKAEPVGARDVEVPELHGRHPRAPGQCGPRHRRSEEVARLEACHEGVAGEAGAAVGARLHQELGRAVLGHAVAPGGQLLPLARAALGHGQGVGAEGRVGRERDGLAARPEGR